jgi:hypothetical protein
LSGEYQDTVVSRPVLRELAGQAHLDGGNGFTYGLMHAAETTEQPERAEASREVAKNVQSQEHRAA